MKYIILVVMLFAGITFGVGCNKMSSDRKCSYTQEDMNNIVAPAAEVKALTEYLDYESIDAVKDPRGFYYKIDSAGSTDKPLPCASVSINYVGKLTSGKTFDQGTEVAFNLENLITGWQIGVPLIGKGGKITLYLPPSFAYGSSEINGIPPNSILIFSIDLINFTNP